LRSDEAYHMISAHRRGSRSPSRGIRDPWVLGNRIEGRPHVQLSTARRRLKSRPLRGRRWWAASIRTSRKSGAAGGATWRTTPGALIGLDSRAHSA
jgi:hypothetical protein